MFVIGVLGWRIQALPNIFYPDIKRSVVDRYKSKRDTQKSHGQSQKDIKKWDRKYHEDDIPCRSKNNEIQELLQRHKPYELKLKRGNLSRNRMLLHTFSIAKIAESWKLKFKAKKKAIGKSFRPPSSFNLQTCTGDYLYVTGFSFWVRTKLIFRERLSTFSIYAFILSPIFRFSFPVSLLI